MSTLKAFQDLYEAQKKSAKTGSDPRASDEHLQAGEALTEEALTARLQKKNYTHVAVDERIINSARTTIRDYCHRCFKAAQAYSAHYQPYIQRLYGESVHAEIQSFLEKGERGEVGFDEFVQVCFYLFEVDFCLIPQFVFMHPHSSGPLTLFTHQTSNR